eukprot:ctg_208.g132
MASRLPGVSCRHFGRRGHKVRLPEQGYHRAAKSHILARNRGDACHEKSPRPLPLVALSRSGAARHRDNGCRFGRSGSDDGASAEGIGGADRARHSAAVGRGHGVHGGGQHRQNVGVHPQHARVCGRRGRLGGAAGGHRCQDARQGDRVLSLPRASRSAQGGEGAVGPGLSSGGSESALLADAGSEFSGHSRLAGVVLPPYR